MPQKLNTQGFIARSVAIHGSKYDYSKAVYVNARTKLKIICQHPKHGFFYQTPNTHLSGSGCPDCGKNAVKRKRRSASLIGLLERSEREYRPRHKIT